MLTTTKLGSTTVYEDNEGAIKLATNPMTSHITKHVNIRHHVTRDLFDTTAIISVSNGDMPVTGLTMALPNRNMLHSSNAA
jgi:hypothetical protein